jgi:hypothetical protein
MIKHNEINILRKYSGFFAILTHLVNFDPNKNIHAYCLRDEQENYF